MPKICVNTQVIDKYRGGMSLNDAISDVFEGEIKDKISNNAVFANMSPLQMVMADAGISKYSTVGDIMNTANSSYTSSPMESNEWLFPAWVESTIKEATYAQSIISYICNTTIGVDSNIVKAATLDLMSNENKSNIRRARVSEGADLPPAKIRIGEKAITLWKHGRALEMTYEAVRRMRIDLFTKHMSAIINDIAGQDFDDAIDVAIRGDGNANSAATQLGTLATAGKITADELVSYMIDYWATNHFNADTIVAPLPLFKQLAGMTFNTNLAFGASARVSLNLPQIGAQSLNVLTGNLPQVSSKNVILLANRSNTLTRYEENGSNIQENQSFARNQTNLLTTSLNSGYAIGTIGSNMYISDK